MKQFFCVSKWHEDCLIPSWFFHLYSRPLALFFFLLLVFDIFSFSLFSAILFAFCLKSHSRLMNTRTQEVIYFFYFFVQFAWSLLIFLLLLLIYLFIYFWLGYPFNITKLHVHKSVTKINSPFLKPSFGNFVWFLSQHLKKSSVFCVCVPSLTCCCLPQIPPNHIITIKRLFLIIYCVKMNLWKYWLMVIFCQSCVTLWAKDIFWVIVYAHVWCVFVCNISVKLNASALCWCNTYIACCWFQVTWLVLTSDLWKGLKSIQFFSGSKQ